MSEHESPECVPANPSNWSIASQRSVAAKWTTAYTSYRYKCWRCQASTIFSAEDQRYTYEVKKAPIDQRRILCKPCWQRANEIVNELKKCELRWAEEKPTLQYDKIFLEGWLQLLTEHDEYVPYRSDSAKKRMLAKLLSPA